jgi:hypothetical protein
VVWAGPHGASPGCQVSTRPALGRLLSVTNGRERWPVVVLDDDLCIALRVAVRALEDQAAAARASASLTGAATPEVSAYREAAARLRAVLDVA